MIGVSGGIAATVGLLKPNPEVLTQMIACMGTGITYWAVGWFMLHIH